MTDTEQARAPEWASWTRRTWVTIWVSVALVVLLVAGLCVKARLTALDDEYGPLGVGSTFGRNSPDLRFDGDGFGNARLVTKGNRTTYVYGSMVNDGSHSVRVTRFDRDDTTVGTQWAPYPDDDTPIPDANAHWRDFPGTIGAGVEVMMRYTIRRPPHCQDEPMQSDGGEFYRDTHVAHWESLLGDHITDVGGKFDPIDQLGIQVC